MKIQSGYCQPGKVECFIEYIRHFFAAGDAGDAGIGRMRNDKVFAAGA